MEIISADAALIQPLLFVLPPLIVPFIIITYYIICIIRMQYNLFFFYINCNLKSIYGNWKSPQGKHQVKSLDGEF